MRNRNILLRSIMIFRLDKLRTSYRERFLSIGLKPMIQTISIGDDGLALRNSVKYNKYKKANQLILRFYALKLISLFSKTEPPTGFEPATYALRMRRSTS